MKYFLILLFALTLPLLLFLTTLLIDNHAASNLKAGLREKGAYSELSKSFAKRDVKNADGGESFGNFVTKRFQPDYIQLKTESAIDQTADWFTGKSQTEPLVNLKEL